MSDLGEKTLDCLRFIAGNPTSEYSKWADSYAALCAKWSEKAVDRKLEQLADKGWVEYGVSARTGWLTDEGRAVVDDLDTGAEGALRSERTE